jgi:hypothetical protein
MGGVHVSGSLQCKISLGSMSARGQNPKCSSTITRPLSPAADMPLHWLSSEKCHVWTAPSWQGLSSRRRTWSVQPCVRPLSAVRMTAGHNALRGSGPGQNLAFEMQWHEWVVLTAGSTGSALRAVRPPNLHITPDSRRDLATVSRRPGNCTARPEPSVPRPFGQAYWQAR